MAGAKWEDLHKAKAELDRLQHCLRLAGADIHNLNDEIDRLRALKETEVDTNNHLRAEIDRLRAEIAELRRALLEYGGHQHSCRRNTYPLLEPKICDCGWAEFFIKYTKTAKEGESISAASDPESQIRE